MRYRFIFNFSIIFNFYYLGKLNWKGEKDTRCKGRGRKIKEEKGGAREGSIARGIDLFLAS